ncbi:MAG: CRISPR-associated helicase Cas3' [Gammaproteobacteria bacterium]|nr:CRISPR-associated helicase Cas3' [Gammaproteobacteria bacterium]
MYLAHSENDVGETHPLKAHLAAVSALAREFMKEHAMVDETALAGVLHDLGKYGDRFQLRLQGKDSGLDHWSQGASVALSQFQAVAAALAIEGHHIGLQRGSRESLRRLLPDNLVSAVLPGLALSDPDIARLQSRAVADGLKFHKPAAPAITSWAHAVAAMLDVRMLFSCLVDADFLDTEAHFNGNALGKQPRQEGPRLDAEKALAALDAHMDGLRAKSQAQASVRDARETLWKSVIHAGQLPSKLFTLTAPTGSGKTLAMLRLALEHALRHGKKRIVLAVPFLTVIEQTARVYRRVFAGFPDHFVLEHHSLAGLGEESEKRDAEGSQERQRRLLSENWDAPIVLTTNVQLLESLFSNRPSSCRKLHNLMDSVILFDEAQSLPQHLAVPTLAALSHLTAAYRSTVVFATATQPAFDTLDAAVNKHAVSGWRPREAVPEHPTLFKTLERVTVRWPERDKKRSWAELAAEIHNAHQVLVVVNLKRHALALLETLAGTDGLFHLSTNLCAEHRRAVLNRVRKRLHFGKPCRLISTQCVEAGVDVDFPVVFRAMAPLEAIAQAAGRCNREGKLNEQGRLGEVVVFEPDEESGWRKRFPTHSYFQAAQVTQTLLSLHGNLNINDPETFRAYYHRLYDLNDPASQNANLAETIQALDFPEIAKAYRIIEQNAIQVLVPWADRWEDFQLLRAVADKEGITTDWMHRAQGLAVSIYRTNNSLPTWAIPAKLRRGGFSDEWFILEGDFYDDTLGLNPPKGELVFIA